MRVVLPGPFGPAIIKTNGFPLTPDESSGFSFLGVAPVQSGER